VSFPCNFLAVFEGPQATSRQGKERGKRRKGEGQKERKKRKEGTEKHPWSKFLVMSLILL